MAWKKALVLRQCHRANAQSELALRIGDPGAHHRVDAQLRVAGMPRETCLLRGLELQVVQTVFVQGDGYPKVAGDGTLQTFWIAGDAREVASHVELGVVVHRITLPC